MTGTALKSCAALPSAGRALERSHGDTAGARTRPGTRGFGSLPVLLLLLLGSFLIMLYANRAAVQELRTATVQQRAAQAFEAAEAGRAWGQVLINDPRGLDGQCTPALGTTTAPTSWRERMLPPAASLNTDATTRAGCTATTDTTWSCACPSSGVPALPPAAADERSRARFTVRLQSGSRAELVWLHAQGCLQDADACDPNMRDARLETHVLLAPWPFGDSPANASLVALGAAALGPEVTLVNADATSGGMTLSSAVAPVVSSTTRLSSLPGRAAADSLRAPDSRWLDETASPLGVDDFFRRLYGLARADLATLPGVTRLTCTGACTGTDLETAWRSGARWLWLDGPLDITAATTLGSAERPLGVIAAAVSIRAAVQWSGWLHAAQLTWDSGTAPSSLRGNLVSSGAAQLAGRLRIDYDAALLAQWRRLSAPLLPVPGSWRDHTEGT